MKDLILSIFGEYEAVTYTVTNGVYNPALDDVEQIQYSAVASGFAGVDWPFVLGVLVFIVALYCVLRIVGAVISRV